MGQKENYIGSKDYKFVVIATMFFIGGLLVVGGVSAQNATIYIDDYKVPPGVPSIEILINLNLSESSNYFGGAQFNVSFDNNILNATVVTKNTNFDGGLCNINNSMGLVRCTLASSGGIPPSDFMIMRINFTINQSFIGVKTILSLSVKKIIDYGCGGSCEALDYTYSIENGSLQINCTNDSACGASNFCNTTTHLCQANITTITCYGDADNDTFGNATNTTTTTNVTCPLGYVNNSLDCNDTNNATHPGATDIPNNGIDENCNGSDNITYYADLDNDTYGNLTNNQTTDYIPSGMWITNVSMATDCNDSNPAIHPNAAEIYNGIDDNCNEIIDDCSSLNQSINAQIYCNVSGIMNYKKVFNTTCSAECECLSDNCTDGKCAGYLCYMDADSDGFGNATNYNVSNTSLCPTNYVNNSDDCNDNNSAINPNTVWYFDYDNDGYGNAINNATNCTKPSGNWVLNNKDCKDNNSYVNPGVTEKIGYSYIIIGNTINTTYYTSSDYYTSSVGIDNDCDGIINEQCHTDADCGSNYYCSGYTCYKKSSSEGGYTGVVDLTPPSPAQPTTLNEFSGVPGEAEGLILTFNLGKDAKGASVTATVGNKTNTAIANNNGTVTIALPGYGQGEITASKTGFRTLTKTINVYAGTLNIVKISGEKYGDEFKFKVTTKDGTPVKDAKVVIYGKELKTDASGIVKTTVKTIQAGLEASASAKDYKGSSISFDVQAIGKITIDTPKKVTQGDTITIIVRDENKNPVPNAKVTINSVEHTADANGKIEYKVTTTSLTLKAESEGYIPSEQTSVTVEAKIECGNGKCESGETKENCAKDCIVCGDKVCDTGESYKNCASDCPKPSDNTLLIIAGILIVILLIAAYYFLVMRKKKGGEE